MNKPNFIFILMDDMGWRDLTCQGSEFYETPNIDRLCSQGVQFTNAYAACPVCSPTRASILTGKYPARVGVTDWIDWGGRAHPCKGKLIDVPYIHELPLEETTLATALKEVGYNTWHVGKWHLGCEPYWPEKQGFDVNIGGWQLGAPIYGYFSPWRFPTLEDAPDGKYLPDHLMDETIKLIKNNDGKPFFLNFWFYSVHTPIQAKEEKIGKYERKMKDTGLDKVKTFEEGEYFPGEHKKNKRVLRRLVQSDPVYAAMIESVDENIGRLLDTLEQEGLADDTIFFFFSDNGGLATSEGSPTCNAPLAQGKGWMYEGGTREPLFIKWPGVVQAGSTCDVPVISTDFYPTMLEMAGADPLPQQHVDGESLVPLLKGQGEPGREAIYWHYPHYGNQGGTPGCSVRRGDYKLIEFFEDCRLELYNLVEDIGEDHNLVDEMPALAVEMHKMLVAWREGIEAKIPGANPEYEPWG